jgi:hypothetical protein
MLRQCRGTNRAVASQILHIFDDLATHQKEERQNRREDARLRRTR